jgi:nucleoside-diphosphate-sugar epimerase
VAPLKALFIGGSGEISAACSRRAVEVGIDLHVLNRGQTAKRPLPAQARVITADIRDAAAARAAIGAEEYDVVVNFVAFTPEHVQADIDLFGGRVGQYVFISSASAYQKPVARLPITESTPLRNPVWPYSQAKIACEDLLVRAYRENGFPATIVRPSHTYDHTQIPYDTGWTMIDRMRRGKEVVVHGDGTSLWTLTHTSDFALAFVGLLGRPQAIGDSFHITSDDVLTWNQIHEILAEAAGAPRPRIVHVASESILAHDETWGRSLLGDKAHSVVFDNTKVRRLVPDYVATVPFWRGAREILEWYDDDPSRGVVDPRMDALLDRLVDRFGTGSEPVAGSSTLGA